MQDMSLPVNVCPDTHAAALVEGSEHICELVVLGHSHELGRRTSQEKQWERENSTSHPIYRTTTAEQLVKEGKEADPRNNLMIS